MSGKKETAKQIKTNPRTTWRYATKEEQKISQKTMPKSLVFNIVAIVFRLLSVVEATNIEMFPPGLYIGEKGFQSYLRMMNKSS